MMAVIWKYAVPAPGETNNVEMPVGAKFLRVENGHMWVLVPESSTGDYRDRTFTTVGTGHPFDDRLLYVGTYFDGPYEWHVMESVS